ncbi:hypothetical protein GGI15_000876 [Coemansia interrupta]|uniref:C2H2-type domain-containing protein n=1 Tax=Coemansia interrupta TaxID=1126814 RepID=A0A9W8HSB6_9FUNG|nr:hypothetical protein GGI15_000876 [Coemansia interrupta]
MLPSVRELLAFGDQHTQPLISPVSASSASTLTPFSASAVSPYAQSQGFGAMDASGSSVTSRQPSEVGEPINYPRIGSHQREESDAAAKQRPGRKARSTNRYTSPSDSRQYKCGLQSCLAVFKRPEHLKRHMLTHTQVRPFICEALNCGKRFSRRDNYVTHMKKHGPVDFPPTSVSEINSRSSSRCSSTGSHAASSAGCRSPALVNFSSIRALLNQEEDSSDVRHGLGGSQRSSESNAPSTHGNSSSASSSHGDQTQRSLALPPLELLAYASTHSAPPPQPHVTSQPPNTTPLSNHKNAALALAPTQAIRVSMNTGPHSPDGSRMETSLVNASSDSRDASNLDASSKLSGDSTTLTATVITSAGDPSKPFMCSICESRFGRLEHVKRHHLVHTGQRKYVCPSCSKTFARKDNMIQHMRAHERKKVGAVSVHRKV